MSTRRQQALEFIAANQRVVTVGPTLRQLAEHLGVVPNAAQQHVAALREEGQIEDNDGRGIVVKTATPVRVPIFKPSAKKL